MPFISSSGPRIVVLLAALGAGVTSAAAAWQVFTAGRIPWVLLALGVALTLVALAGSLMWKRVQCGERHYVVSDFFKSETISFNDVCMVVKAPGVLWNTVHIHLRRPSRFGWEIAFVPKRAVRTSQSQGRPAGSEHDRTTTEAMALRTPHEFRPRQLETQK